jgi:hypothetical protein
MDGKQKTLLVIGLLLLAIGTGATMFLVKEIKTALDAPADVLVMSQNNDEPRHVLSGTTAKERLDGPVVKLEIPRNEDEFLSLAPNPTHRLWRGVLWGDLIFMAGYVLLFLTIPFQANGGATIWERVGFLGQLTAIADLAENAMIYFLLEHSEGQLADRVFGTCIAILTMIGAVKWLLFFLACRALSIELEKLMNWRWIAVALRAFSTAGSWTALLALVGMPARPLLTLMFYGSAVLLLIVAVQRLRGVPAGPGVSEQAEDVDLDSTLGAIGR